MSERARAAIARTKAARAAIDAFIAGKADKIKPLGSSTSDDLASPTVGSVALSKNIERETSMATQAEYAKAWRIRDAVKKQQATPEQVEWLALYEVRAPRGRPRGSKTNNGRKAAPASAPTRAIERPTPSALSPILAPLAGLDDVTDSRWAIAQLASRVASGIAASGIQGEADSDGIAQHSINIALAIVRGVGLAP